MPYCALLMLLFWIVLELLFDPRLEAETVELPSPMPMSVVAVLLPATFRFLIVLLVAPSAPLLWSHTTAVVVAVEPSLIVRLRSVPTPPSDPSIVTRSAAFRRTKPPEGVTVLVIVRAAPVGKMWTVKLLPVGSSWIGLSATEPSSPTTRSPVIWIETFEVTTALLRALKMPEAPVSVV